MTLPPEYFINNYGRCLLGDGCHCVRELASWRGSICAQWEPTKARSFEELIAIAKAEREKRDGRSNGGR
jgi:hypothetical protein